MKYNKMKQEWKTGDIITPDILNSLENNAEEVSEQIQNVVSNNISANNHSLRDKLDQMIVASNQQPLNIDKFNKLWINTSKDGMSLQVPSWQQFSTLSNSIIKEYDENQSYTVGDFVTKNQLFYYCISNTSGGLWDDVVNKFKIITIDNYLNRIQQLEKLYGNLYDITILKYNLNDYPLTLMQIAGNNTWYRINKPNNFSAYMIPVPYRAKTVKIKTNQNGVKIALLAQTSNIVQQYNQVIYSTGYNNAINIQGNTEANIILPENCTYVWINTKLWNATIQQLVDYSPEFFGFSCVNPVRENIYIAPDGNDNNCGSSFSPLATVNEALRRNAKNICIAGGTYFQQIDLSLVQTSSINIINGNSYNRVIFMAPECIVTNTQTKVSQYNKVYSAQILNSRHFHDWNIWLYQDKVPDESTSITSEKRMPQHRGLPYRNLDTKIIKATSKTLAAALNQIDTSDQYKWYKNNNTLYFSRPESVSTNPICIGTGYTGLFSRSPSQEITINMSGIDVKYMSFNVESLVNCVIKDCSASNVYGNGAFTFKNSREIMFIRCEARNCINGTSTNSALGDGFYGTSENYGEPFSYQTTSTFIDCWAHDNNNSGIGIYGRNESTIIGGLYEQNYYGGGITASVGAHCTCHNVYTRDNGNAGFLYLNSASSAEGGVGGQIKCINCISQTNTTRADSNSPHVNATPCGYKITSNGNRGIFINCKAIDEKYGYYITPNTSSLMTLIDCGELNCETPISGDTNNITIKNTNLLTLN